MSIKVGDGRQCSLFYDKWLAGGRICDRVGSVDPWHNFRFVCEWRSGDDWCIPVSFERRFPDIAEEMKCVNMYPTHDVPVWEGHVYNVFSIQSCYNLLRAKGNPVYWHIIAWHPAVFPRYGFILWLVLRGRLKLT